MALETRTDMEATINAGNVVLFNGQRYYTVDSLPTQDEIDQVYATGSAGESAYQAAVDIGFVGTKAQWLASLVGATGAKGDKGDTGDTGPAGEGSGNVNGPASAVDNNIAVFDGVTGTLIKDGGATIASKQDALGYTPVPNTRTVNAKALSSNVTLDTDDLSDSGKTNKFVTAAEKTKLSNLSGTNSGDQDLSGLVPNTRTVNTKALSSNITLNPDDLSDASTTNKFVTAAEKTKLSNLSGTNSGDQTISDATISTTDITTNNVSTSKHGFAPKLPNDATKFLDGTGAYSVPVSSAKGAIFTVYGGANTPTGSGGTQYNAVMGGGGFVSTSGAIRQSTVPYAGTIKNLYVKTQSTCTGGTCVVTVQKNGVDTALTLTISSGAAAGTFSNTSTSVSIAAGDSLCMKFLNNATAGPIMAEWCFEYAG